ncbi:hypothetical protein C8F04DRAFT_1214201 [Mycena alexandri]|uniref:Uncharacterized protein n=1 Tax=Mycena alexandri TaxID=1745969 RepID=A0AAD6S366_9AGAR|nr:hypothetical protein C8F04DRAFT_1214201 [Mycena alexandri]
MAPAAKTKEVPEGQKHTSELRVKVNQSPKGFFPSEDRQRLHCVVCTAQAPPGTDCSVDWKNRGKHENSAAHKRAVTRNTQQQRDVAEIRRNQDADAMRQRDTEMQFAGLRDVQLPEQRTYRVQTTVETDLWMQIDQDPQGAGFDAGISAAAHRDTLLGLWNAETMGLNSTFSLDPSDTGNSLDEDDTDEILAEIMRSAAISDPQIDDILNFESFDEDKKSAEWFPYPSKILFLLDTLDNLPRLRISNSLMKVFLWILKESGAHDVPSFEHLRKVQKSLRTKCGVPTTQYKTAKGNIFHMNDPRTLVAKDWANPETRKFIHVYPEIPEDGVIREIWHAQKWRKDMDLDNLSPMYAAPYCHFFVNELARLKNGDLFIPIRWIKFKNVVCADAFKVELNDEGFATVLDASTILVSTLDLVSNFLDLEDEHGVPPWTAETKKKKYPDRMPNPKRALAQGDRIYSCFIDYFGDDVSGNRSKSWNKHWNAYMTNRGLPRELLQQEYHVHFISTSPNASITEQFTVFKSVLELTHKDPVKVRDADTHETSRLCIYVNAGPSDNPMQSEITGHIGAKGNHMCRKCKAGGTEKEKETDACFHSLFEPGTPRSKEDILAELKKQVKLACSGIAQPIKKTQTETGVKDAYTQHWINYLLDQFAVKKAETPTRSTTEIEEELVQWTLDNEAKIYSGFLTLKGFDPTKDTPVEILHTILLGVVKYIWHSSHTKWNDTQKQTYSRRLQATNIDGLSVHPIRANYIMQYANSLIGRQLKTIAQTNVFHVYGIVNDAQFATWRAVGELSALIWFTEIRNLKEYCSDLHIAVGNVLDSFAVLDPTKILTKIKLHLLSHTPEDVVAFGPLIGVMTEMYECFNAVFRYCSILSNHLAPSRDIALQLADQEGLKHRLTGGWWPSETEGEWEQASPAVRAFLHSCPVLQKLVGWTVKNPHVLVKGAPQPKALTIKLNATHASQALNCGSYDMSATWFPCRQLISASWDECKKASWVFAKSPLTGGIIAGRIDDILDNGSGTAIVILDVFEISDERHEIFGMPVLTRRQSETTYMIIPTLDVKFLFNAQHDCNAAECSASGQRRRMQERVESELIDTFIVHQPLDRFIINTHAFHNAHLLRQVLPRRLTAPIPLFTDRKSKHYELATTLRETKDDRRKQAARAAGEEPKKKQKKRAKTTGGKRKAPATRKAAPKARKSNREEGESGGDASQSDSDRDISEESDGPPRKKQRRQSNGTDSDSDYNSDYAARAEEEEQAEGGGIRRQARARRMPARFAHGASDFSDSE